MLTGAPAAGTSAPQPVPLVCIAVHRVEEALRRAALGEEVKDNLRQSGLDLSGGQPQRPCIARAIAPRPKVLLLDEATCALDPLATGKIEDLIEQLRNDLTIVIVTHNLPDIGDHVRLLKEDGSTVLEGRIKSRLFNYANSYCHAISSSRIRMSASMFWPPNKRKIDRWLPHRISEHGVKA